MCTIPWDPVERPQSSEIQCPRGPSIFGGLTLATGPQENTHAPKMGNSDPEAKLKLRNRTTALRHKRTISLLSRQLAWVHSLTSWLFSFPSSRQESGGTTHAQLPPVEEIASAGGYDPVRRYARRWSPMPEEALIRFESGTVILLEIKILLGLAQHAVADYEHIQLVAHEAAESVFRCADDRLTAHVEAGVDQHRTPGPRLESREQPMKAGIGRRADGLNAGGIIDMGYRGNFRARNIELVDAEQRLLLSAHGAPLVPPHVGHDQHVRAV